MLIQINLLRRDNSVFISAISKALSHQTPSDSQAVHALPTGNERLSILLHVSRKTPHRRRTPFRVTSGNDPSLFESGSDLLRPDGHPRSRPLYFLFILCMKNLGKIDLLRTTDRILAAFRSRRCVYRPSHALYTLNVTFIVDFSRSTTIFFVIPE